MNIKRALTFRASSIGDCLVGKYLMENIHAEFPRARCGIVVASRGEMISELLEGYSWLEILEASRRKPLAILKILANFRRTDFTLTQYSENKFSTLSKLFARLVTKRGGFFGFEDGWRWNKFIYDKVLPFSGEAKSFGLIYEEAAALAAAGIGAPIKNLSLIFKKGDSVLAKFGLAPGKFIILHLFSGSESRGLKQNKREALVSSVFKKFGSDYEIVLTGGPADAPSALKAAGNLPVKITAGQTKISELINLIYLSRAVLSVDSGAAHIAGHLKKSLVVLARCEALSAWWSPLMYRENLSVLCDKTACPGGTHIGGNFPKCLNNIDMDIILNEIEKYVGKN